MTEMTLNASIDIERPAAEVWAILADYRRDVEWRDGVLAMTPDPAGPVAPGTTTAEDLRFAGRTWHNDGVVVDVQPGERFSWRTTDGADARGSRSVEALGPGRCRAHLELVVTPHGGERLMRPVLGRMLRRNLIGDLNRLHALVTAAATVDAA